MNGKMTNCNIIIPTYNRPFYLKRILSYYRDSETAYPIIVADSSSDENKELNKKVISSISNLDIQYLDGYSVEINPYHKMADVVNYADAKYCVFCADDDFVTPNGIKHSVDFLEKNPDFIVAQGRYIGFTVAGAKKGKPQFRWEFAYVPSSIEFSDPKSRLGYHLSKYVTPTVYGVHRSNDLKIVYQEVLKSKVDLFFFGELLSTMLTVVYGKTKYLDVFYAARDEDSLRWRYWPSLKDAMDAGVYHQEYAKFRDCLANNLSQWSQLDIAESAKVIDEAMSAHLAAYMKIYYPPKRKLWYLLKALHLPAWLDGRIRKTYEELKKARRDWKRSTGMSPSSAYYEDFNRIRLHVLSYSKMNLE